MLMLTWLSRSAEQVSWMILSVERGRTKNYFSNLHKCKKKITPGHKGPVYLQSLANVSKNAVSLEAAVYCSE